MSSSPNAGSAISDQEHSFSAETGGNGPKNAELGSAKPGNVKTVAKTQRDWLAVGVWVIAFAVLFAGLYWLRPIVVPLVLAVLGYLVLRPVVCRVAAIGIPQTASAILVMLGLVASVLLCASMILVPAQQWVAKAPESFADVKSEIDELREPLQVVEKTEQKIDQLRDAEADAIVKVDVAEPKLIDESTIVSQTGRFFVFLFVVLVTTLFLLTTGDELLERLLAITPTRRGREELMQLVVDLQDSVGKYLGQITMINIGLGVAVSLVMWLMGLPTPILWGALATVCNFIPYVGPIAATGIVTLAAVSHFDSISQGLMTGGAFWLTTAVEGQFVTPAILGKTMKVGPVIVLASVALWGYLWGLAGIFLAVPMAISARLICERFSTTRPVAVMLGSPQDTPDPAAMTVAEDQPLSSAA